VRSAIGHRPEEKVAFSICDRVDLRIAPGARAPDRLILLPPFPPAAERCAFTWVESIICVWVERPRPASWLDNRSRTPRLAHRTKRLSNSGQLGSPAGLLRTPSLFTASA
jgi:hypothetical protein